MSVFLRRRHRRSQDEDEEEEEQGSGGGIWHLIMWMGRHEKYMTIGYVLAEYATKTMLSHFLSQERARSYSELLGMMGFDVQDVGLWTVGKTVMELAPPLSIVHALSRHGGGHTAEKMLGQRLVATTHAKLLRSLTLRVHNLSEMPAVEPQPGCHDEFAAYLTKQQGSSVAAIMSSDATQAKAREIYHGYEWFEVGASCLLKRMQKMGAAASSAAIISGWLRESYTKWRLWGVRWWPAVMQVDRKIRLPSVLEARQANYLASDAALQTERPKLL